MAVATKTKTVTRTTTKGVATNRPAPVEETETKEEPKVIVDQKLGKILKEYNSAEKQTASVWLKIVDYVKEQELTRDVVKATYIANRGVAESTANVEVTMIFNACKEEHADNLELALAGEMTVRDFRKSIMKPREGHTPKEEDVEKKLRLKLKQSSRYAIEKVDIDDPKDFGRLAREVFTEVLERYTSQQEEGEEAEDEGEEEEAE